MRSQVLDKSKVISEQCVHNMMSEIKNINPRTGSALVHTNYGKPMPKSQGTIRAAQQTLKRSFKLAQVVVRV